MIKQGIDFLESWLTEHITEGMKRSVDGDGASLSVELAERLIADAEKAGLALYPSLASQRYSSMKLLSPMKILVNKAIWQNMNASYSRNTARDLKARSNA